MKFDDNPILLDSNSSKKQKILCVLCKIELDCFNVDENRFRCPRCRNTYQLGFEILPQEDELESSHSNELDEGSGLLSADSEFIQHEDSIGKIKRPKYMQDSDTTKVEYREY